MEKIQCIKKILCLAFIFLIFGCVFSQEAYGSDLFIGFEGGYLNTSISVIQAGDEIFGKGGGNELDQVLGVRNVGDTLWWAGNIEISRYRYIHFQAEAGYWSKTEKTQSIYFPEINVNTKFSDIFFGGNVLLYSAKEVTPFIGGGISLHHLKIGTEPVGFPEASEEGTINKLGIGIMGGVKLSPSQSYKIVFGLRVNMISNWNNLIILSGIQFKL